MASNVVSRLELLILLVAFAHSLNSKWSDSYFAHENTVNLTMSMQRTTSLSQTVSSRLICPRFEPTRPADWKYLFPPEDQYRKIQAFHALSIKIQINGPLCALFSNQHTRSSYAGSKIALFNDCSIDCQELPRHFQCDIEGNRK